MHCSKKHWIIIVLCLLQTWCLYAQDSLSFESVDKGTYQLWENKQWKALSDLCDKALENGYDYYYLRVRAGIAAFELKEYRASIVHFTKAYEQNSEDDLPLEYLYYAYLYSNREEAARNVSKTFSRDLAARLHTKKLSPLAYAAAEAGVKPSDSLYRYHPAAFSQLSASHYIGRQVSLFHAFSFYSQKEKRFDVTQLQYYVRATVPLKKELTLSGGAHLLYGNANINEQIVVQYTVQDQPIMKGAPFPPPRLTTSLQTVPNREQSLALAGAVNLTKHLPVADLSIGATAFALDTAKQYQLNGGIMLYPLRNNNLGLGGNCFVHTETASGSFNLAYSPVVSARLYKGLFVSISYFANKGLNVTEQTAYFINNSYDYTLNRLLFSPSYAFSNKTVVYATIGTEEKKILSGAFTYHYAIFMAGIRINSFYKRH